MFTMSEKFIHARIFMLLARKGSPVVPSAKPVEYATGTDFENKRHDEELITKTLTGQTNRDAAQLFESIRPQLKTDLLRDCTADEVKAAFGGNH
jgi:hypothetical protein